MKIEKDDDVFSAGTPVKVFLLGDDFRRGFFLKQTLMHVVLEQELFDSGKRVKIVIPNHRVTSIEEDDDF